MHAPRTMFGQWPHRHDIVVEPFISGTVHFRQRNLIISYCDKTGQQWPGIYGSLAGLRGNRRCNCWWIRWSLHLHFDHIAGIGVNLQLSWCTIEEWPCWVRVSFWFNFYLLVCLWHILSLFDNLSYELFKAKWYFNPDTYYSQTGTVR